MRKKQWGVAPSAPGREKIRKKDEIVWGIPPTMKDEDVEKAPSSLRHTTLLELLDRVLDKGVVIRGDITLAVADVDLIYLGLAVVLASVERMKKERGRDIELESSLRKGIMP